VDRIGYGEDGDPFCADVPGALAALRERGVRLVTAETLAKALSAVVRSFWAESEALGWHYRAWFDEDIQRPAEDGSLAAAILAALAEEA